MKIDAYALAEERLTRVKWCCFQMRLNFWRRRKWWLATANAWRTVTQTYLVRTELNS